MTQFTFHTHRLYWASLGLSLFLGLAGCTNNSSGSDAGADSSSDTSGDTSEDTNTSSCSGGEVCSPSVGAGETAATVPTSAAGEYELTYDFAQTNSPFTDGTTGTFEITDDNKLIVSLDGEECIILENPVFRFGATSGNFVFKDNCARDIAYNVSTTTAGDFNEINVEPLDTQGWYGQFHE